MSLLAGVAYDPGTAVSKACSALLAMTQFDTTNLRLTFTAPANGSVLVRQAGCFHGAAGYAQVLLGVMSGSTVLARMSPSVDASGTVAATTRIPFEKAWPITGLTGGVSYTLDAAYSVEVLLASCSIKYGGPNNTTTDDAFGAYVFEVWDTA